LVVVTASTTVDLAALLLEAWSWRDRNPKRAQSLLNQVLESSSELLQAQAQVVGAYLAFRERRMVDALELGGQAITVLREQQATSWVARALNVRVCVTAELGDFASADAAIEEQLRLSREVGDLEMEGCALHDLGMIHFERSPKLAEPYLLAALEVFSRLELQTGLAFTKLNLSNLYEHLGRSEMAQTSLEEALEVATTEGIVLVEILARAQQARFAVQQNDFDRAEHLLQDTLERAQQLPEYMHWDLVPPLVQVHLHFQRPLEAIKLLEHHLVLVRQAGLRPFEVAGHELLADVLAGIGEDRTALEHYREHMRLYRQVFDEANEERTRALGVLVRTQLAEQEAQAERQKNIELRATLEQLERAHQHILEISLTDELTGIRNRRYLMAHGAAQLREHPGFAVALLDLDHFKRINDTLGHDGGDRVLREFASVLQNNLRGADTFARFGGEEFAVLFPETSPQAACEVLERIRAVMASRVWSSLPDGQRITFTAGVADGSSGDLMEALHHADERLYEGKANGRDRIW
jgi:diguanylate cyclase (GGDEF)-like protein